MQKRENYYISVGLDPSITDKATVEAKLDEIEKKWRDLANKSGKPEHKSRIEKLPDIRAVLLDDGMREKEAKNAVMLRALDPAKLTVARQALPETYTKLEESLAHIKCTDIYDFLSRDPSDGSRIKRLKFLESHAALAEHARDLMEKYRNIEGAADRMQLSSLIFDLVSNGYKGKYDAYAILSTKFALCAEIDKIVDVVAELSAERSERLSQEYARVFLPQNKLDGFIQEYCSFREYKTGTSTPEPTAAPDPAGKPKNAPKPKKNVTAGLLGIFLGSIGVHDFYLGRKARACTHLFLIALTIVSSGSLGVLALVSAGWGLIEGVAIYRSKNAIASTDPFFNACWKWIKGHKRFAMSAISVIVVVCFAFGALGKDSEASKEESRSTQSPDSRTVVRSTESPLQSADPNSNQVNDQNQDQPVVPDEADLRILLGRDLPAFQSFSYEESIEASMGGKKHGNVLIFRDDFKTSHSYANFNLEQKYSAITGVFGHADGTPEFNVTLHVYGDNKLIKSVDLKSNMFDEQITINTAGVGLLKMEVTGDGKRAEYAFSDMALSTEPIEAALSDLLLGPDLSAYQFVSYRELTGVTMGGKKHENAILFRDDTKTKPAYANFNLNQQYSKVTGVFGHVDGTAEFETKMNIYGDEKLLMFIDLEPNMFSEEISIDATGIRRLKFEMTGEGKRAEYAFAGMTLAKDASAIPQKTYQPDPNAPLLGADLNAYQSNNFNKATKALMGGNRYDTALVFRDISRFASSYANFNLDRQYSRLTGVFGHADGAPEYDTTMNIYGDGKLLMSATLKPNLFSEEIDLDTTGVRLLKFEMQGEGNRAEYAFAGMALSKDPEAPPPGIQTEVDRNALVLGTDVKAGDNKNFKPMPTVSLGGVTQYNALVFTEKYNAPSYASFDLNDQYTTVSGLYGHVDGTNEYEAVMDVYGDEKLLQSFDLRDNIFSELMELNVEGIGVLKFEMLDVDGADAQYAFCNMIVE